ncbi:MAG: response regulator [Caulobacteraceae bacterium]|nr:response regulator [Caulobacteraceae bacterium]
MNWALLGFDDAFDQTGVHTRAQALARVLIGVLVFFTGLTAIALPTMLAWAALLAAGDTTLWIATDPRNQARRPRLFRALRLAATAVSTCAWVILGLLWWWSPGDYAKAVAVALIGGVLLYTVRGCHRSLAQMLAAGLPPSLALLLLPFTADGLRETVGLLGSLALLVAFAVSSGANAWRAHRELQRATGALVNKQHEAEAASVAKSEFLANMSHEIRTPLNGVLAMAHILDQADLPTREKEAARLICASGEMLERLLSDVLDLAKVEAGQLEIEAAPFHAGEMTRNIVALFRPRADEKGVRLLVDVDPAVDQTYLGDAVRIRQIINNLVSNAVKFTAEGDVRLSLGPAPDGRLRFTVADTGVGFDPALKTSLFERFQQADGSITRRFGGTGLGLAISRHLAEMMGGALDCDGEVGRGAVFWFDVDLPAIAALEIQPEPGSHDTPDAALRLLVADDHPTNLKVVEIILAQRGLAVTCVADGREAVAAHAASRFDVILMDMQMPVMDGLTAVQEIRAAEARSGQARTPIVMLTANAMPEHVRAGQLAGADGHLTKPLTPTSLFAALAEAMALRSPVSAGADPGPDPAQTANRAG